MIESHQEQQSSTVLTATHNETDTSDTFDPCHIEYSTDDPLSDPASRLAEFLPGISRTTMASMITGEVVRHAGAPGSYYRVLQAALGHVGWHGNRIWASYKRLAALATEMDPTDPVSAKTAGRAMKEWCSRLGIRIITDQEELLSGPGEHDYPYHKRGDGPVNHYDVSALRGFIPRELVVAFETMFALGIERPHIPPPAPPRDLEREYPEPFEEHATAATAAAAPPAARAISAPLSAPADVEDDLTYLDIDPFAEPSGSPLSSLPESSGSPSPLNSVYPTLQPPDSLTIPGCSVTNIKNGVEKRGRGGEKRPAAANPETRFDETNLSHTIERYPRAREADPEAAPAPSDAPKPWDEAPPLRLPKVDPKGAGYIALRGLGCSIPLAKKIVRQLGDFWGVMAEIYVRGMDGKEQIEIAGDDPERLSKYTNGVFKLWAQDLDESRRTRNPRLSPVWPKWVEQKYDRIKTAADRAIGTTAAAAPPPRKAQPKPAQSAVPAPIPVLAVMAERAAEIPPLLRPLWDRAVRYLATAVNKPTFETHIRPVDKLMPIDLDEGDGMGPVHVVMAAGIEFTRTWLEKRHLPDLGAAWALALGIEDASRVSVRLVLYERWKSGAEDGRAGVVVATANTADPERDRLADQARQELRRDHPGAPQEAIDALVEDRIRVIRKRGDLEKRERRRYR